MFFRCNAANAEQASHVCPASVECGVRCGVKNVKGVKAQNAGADAVRTGDGCAGCGTRGGVKCGQAWKAAP